MTDAELQELFARLERLERSTWRWRVFASVLAVLFLLLLSLGLVTFVAIAREAVARQRLVEIEAREAEQRARAEADLERLRYLERVRLAGAPLRADRGAVERAPAAPKHMPRAEEP